jgi:hypothetical protein
MQFFPVPSTPPASATKHFFRFASGDALWPTILPGLHLSEGWEIAGARIPPGESRRI